MDKVNILSKGGIEKPQKKLPSKIPSKIQIIESINQSNVIKIPINSLVPFIMHHNNESNYKDHKMTNLLSHLIFNPTEQINQTGYSPYLFRKILAMYYILNMKKNIYSKNTVLRILLAAADIDNNISLVSKNKSITLKIISLWNCSYTNVTQDDLIIDCETYQWGQLAQKYLTGFSNITYAIQNQHEIDLAVTNVNLMVNNLFEINELENMIPFIVPNMFTLKSECLLTSVIHIKNEFITPFNELLIKSKWFCQNGFEQIFYMTNWDLRDVLLYKNDGKTLIIIECQNNMRMILYKNDLDISNVPPTITDIQQMCTLAKPSKNNVLIPNNIVIKSIVTINQQNADLVKSGF